MTDIVFARSNVWLPRVERTPEGTLELRCAGGADALHDPREFTVPIREEHLAVLRADLPRHVLLSAVLLPLCYAAGIRGRWDEHAASALLETVLLGSTRQIDALAVTDHRVQGQLIAHGANISALEDGELAAALSSVTEARDHRRAQEHHAARQRAERAVVLGALDTAILDYTGQRLHGGATRPMRLPDAVDPALLPVVLDVIAGVEAACAGMRIRRDPRKGTRATDTQDWKRLESAAGQALRRLRPELVDDTVRSVSFLLCSEAADRDRSLPFDDEDVPVAGERIRDLAFEDEKGDVERWSPGGMRAAEAFWNYVSLRVSGDDQVFLIEDTAQQEELRLHLYADAAERIDAPSGNVEEGVRSEYGLAGSLAVCRDLVRAFTRGGRDALDDFGPWLSDLEAAQQARRRRAAGEPGADLELARRGKGAEHEQ